LGKALDLTALGAAALAREAMLNGRAEGDIAAGRVTLTKLGAGGSAVALLLSFAAPAPAACLEAPAMANPAAPRAQPAPSQPPGRRLPIRFVWQMDAATRFTLGIDEFARLLGPKTAAALDRPWAEIAAALALDPEGRVAAALAARQTWSGLLVDWPVDDSDERLTIELSALPMFDGERRFTGFRGFGVFRDVDRLEAIERRRAARSAAEPAKILPFRQPAVEPPPTLSAGEHSAFRELARELGERLKKPRAGLAAPAPDDLAAEPSAPARPPSGPRRAETGRDAREARPILDRLPIGVLVYRLNSLIYANRAFLDWAGYQTLDALAEAGGLDCLFIESQGDLSADAGVVKTLTVSSASGGSATAEGRLFGVGWNGENALALIVEARPAAAETRGDEPAALRRLEAEKRELEAILDTTTDGVIVVDRDGRILSANRSAEALFGYDAGQFAGLSFGDLFAPESRRPVLDSLERLARDNGGRVLDAGREAIGLVRQGGLVPLYLTMGRVADGAKICVVLRDVTAWKRSEEELIGAKQAAEKASIAKSEFLAKLSHEIRTPLNAIIGFSEVMLNERLGPIGNERYRQYLKDIHAAGGHLVSLLDDLLDLSKIEAGLLELTFVSVNVNDIVQQCVAIMQEQANRERVIIRTSLPTALPQVVADARSIRQIVLNLLSNSIRFTGAGGQVIVSTALVDEREVVLRVRDTGAGVSEREMQIALEPFARSPTSPRWGDVGTGLGLPITKALVEANHARFSMANQPQGGTLVEVAFPIGRVPAR
jgi:PAS domain S-box-containing protein